jgi:hypothetical protein
MGGETGSGSGTNITDNFSGSLDTVFYADFKTTEKMHLILLMIIKFDGL